MVLDILNTIHFYESKGSPRTKLKLIEEIIELAESIDEIEKPVVPVFVDDWIKKTKKDNYSFGDKDNTEGYKKVSKYMVYNSNKLLEESNE